MSVQGMNHFTVLSDDLEATRKFYCDLLGFEDGAAAELPVPGLLALCRRPADPARHPSRPAARSTAPA